MSISRASRPAAPKSPPVRIGFMSHRSSSRDRLSRLAGARPAQGQPWQGRQMSFRLPLRNISTEAEPLFRPKGKGPTPPPTDHYEAHESNRIGEDSSAHGSAPNCQIAKKDKRRPGVARQGQGGPLRSNALRGGKRDGKSTFAVLEGRSPSGETPSGQEDKQKNRPSRSTRRMT